jgi:hypothetical protein
MKKILAFFIVFSLVASAAFAEGPISFSAWGCGLFAPFVYKAGGGVDGSAQAGVGTGPSWGFTGVAISFTVEGKNENETMGFKLHLRMNNETNAYIAGYPLANVWVKSFGDVLKITVGRYQEDELRGKIGGPSPTLPVGNWFGGEEDAIFSYFQQGTAGAHFGLYPVEGLIFGVSLGVSKSAKGTGNGGDAATQYTEANGDTYNTFRDIYSGLQIGAGYKIPNIGLIRLQYIGGKYDKGNYLYPSFVADGAAIEAVFQLTAVENLNLDFGVKVPFAVKDYSVDPKTIDGTFNSTTGTFDQIPDPDDEGYWGTYAWDFDKVRQPVSIALGANVTAGDLGLLIRLQTQFAGKATEVGDTEDYTKGFELRFGVEPSFKIAKVGTIGADLSFGFNAADKYGSDSFKNNGADFRVGLAASLPLASGEGHKWNDSDKKEGGHHHLHTDCAHLQPLIPA